MQVFTGVAELQAAVGKHLGYSPWRRVTQADVDAFANVTGDHQWIHVDPARAARGIFGRTIVHGHLTFSLVPLFWSQILDVRGVTMLVNYGSDKVRFLKPVPTGSRLRGGAELTGLDEGPRGLLLRATVTIEIEGAVKPACVADTLSLVVA